MPRQNTGDQPSQPLSPFHTPPNGMPVPAPASPFAAPPATTNPAVRSGPTPLGLLYALKRRWVMATFIGGLVAAAVATAVWFAMPAGKHQSRALVQLRPNTADLGGKTTEDFDGYRRSQMFIIKTRDLINRTLAEPSVGQLETVKNNEDAVRMVEDGIKVAVEAPDILSISLSGDNLDDLKLIVDTLVKKYIDDAARYERTNRDEKIKRFEALTDKFKAELQAKEKAIQLMADANATTGVDSENSRLARMQSELDLLNRELFQTTKENQEQEVQIGLLRAKLKTKQFTFSPAELFAYVNSDPRVGPLMMQRLAKQALYEREKEQVNPDNPLPPTVTNLKNEIDSLDKKIVDARALVLPEIEAALKLHAEQILNGKLMDFEDKLTSGKTMLTYRTTYRNEFQSKMGNIAVGSIKVSTLRDELKPMQEFVQRLESQLITLKAERDLEPRVSIREAAVPLPNQNLKQKTLIAVGGSVAAFFAVLVLIGFLEWRTRRVDGVDQVVTELGMRVIGTVPAFPTKANLKAAELAGNANWRFVLNESINSTRTMLLHTARASSMQVVMVTSATQGEGKTSLTSQLASSMATAGMRTLIVDCDLRNPSIHKLFDLGLTAGVSEVLCQEADVSDAVQPTAVPNLWIIPAGQCSNRVITALAQGHPLETLFNRLRGQFDFIIVDSCPVLPVADALLIGQHVDGVVFSIMQDISQLPKVLVASEKLAQLNIPLLGAVVNGIRQNVYSYGYNYVKQLPA